jgi:hypothetical protein
MNIRKVLDRLWKTHRAATPEPWFLLWEVPNEPDDASPDCVGTYDPSNGHPVPLLIIDTDGHEWQDKWSDDLAVTEEARNALPLLLAVAEAAHSYISGPSAEGLQRLTEAIDGLDILALVEE